MWVRLLPWLGCVYAAVRLWTDGGTAPALMGGLVVWSLFMGLGFQRWSQVFRPGAMRALAAVAFSCAWWLMLADGWIFRSTLPRSPMATVAVELGGQLLAVWFWGAALPAMLDDKHALAARWWLSGALIALLDPTVAPVVFALAAWVLYRGIVGHQLVGLLGAPQGARAPANDGVPATAPPAVTLVVRRINALFRRPVQRLAFAAVGAMVLGYVLWRGGFLPRWQGIEVTSPTYGHLEVLAQHWGVGVVVFCVVGLGWLALQAATSRVALAFAMFAWGPSWVVPVDTGLSIGALLGGGLSLAMGLLALGLLVPPTWPRQPRVAAWLMGCATVLLLLPRLWGVAM